MSTILNYGGPKAYGKLFNKAAKNKVAGKPYKHLKRASELLAKQVDKSKGLR